MDPYIRCPCSPAVEENLQAAVKGEDAKALGMAIVAADVGGMDPHGVGSSAPYSDV